MPTIPNVRARRTKSTRLRGLASVPSGTASAAGGGVVCAAVLIAQAPTFAGGGCCGLVWPVPAATIASSVACARGERGDEPALAHDEHAVGEGEHLGQLGGDDQHGDAVAGQR